MTWQDEWRPWLAEQLADRRFRRRFNAAEVNLRSGHGGKRAAVKANKRRGWRR